MTMMRGLSLSFCVRDIAEGRVRVEDVEMIVTNTCARSVQDWERLMDQYSRSYWRGCAEQARRVVELLLASNRIVQPRVENPDYRHSIDRGVWQ